VLRLAQVRRQERVAFVLARRDVNVVVVERGWRMVLMETALLLASLLAANCPRPPQKQRKTGLERFSRRGLQPV
jgi:hypothetical protein